MEKFQNTIKMAAIIVLFAAATAQAQITPQQIIKQCPALPDEESLVLNYMTWDKDLYGRAWMEKVEAAQRVVKAFQDNIAAIRERASATVETQNAAWEAQAKEDGTALANRTSRQLTGRSVEQLEKMSDKEMEAMANSIMQQRLASAGVGNMSAMQGAKPAQPGNTQAQAGLKRIQDRWAAIDREISQSLVEAYKRLGEIYQSHSEPLERYGKDASLKFEQFMDHRQVDKDTYEVAQRRYDQVYQSYLAECFRTWIGHVAWTLSRVEAKMADVTEYDRLMAQKMQSGAITGKGMPSAGFDIADEYLNVALNVVVLPKVEKEEKVDANK
jgi:hypothetical protein